MKYVSTRGQIEPVDFQTAVLMGLADDGGLVIPQIIPDVRDRMDDWRDLSYDELAFEIIRLFATDIPAADLKQLVTRSYCGAFSPEPAPTVPVGDLHVLELWHGPTLSFKDIALQLLGNLFEYILAHRGGELNILGATSGDTGSAAICGVRGRKAINIFMMHPDGKVSPIQKRQMTSVLDANVHNIAVAGSFDDCQCIMKTLAADMDFKRAYSLGAVNSVNWARVMAQIVYYFKSAFDVQRATGAGAKTVRFCVPTGNFGDILAGWYAKQMGAPISRLILATNDNDILSRFFNTGVYSRGQVHHTLAPAMDIQVASNFERYLYYHVGCDADRLRELMAQFAESGSLSIDSACGGQVDEDIEAGSAGGDDVLEAIRVYYEREGYIADPHTACGLSVATSLAPVTTGGGPPPARGEDGDEDETPLICIATAHPAKFPDAIIRATGKKLAHHEAIDALADLPTRCANLPNDVEAVRKFIVDCVG